MRLLSVLILLALVAGCSVGMAAYGHREPDLRNVQVGASKGEVDSYLGKPDKEWTKGENKVAVYEYEVGNEPAPARAGMLGTPYSVNDGGLRPEDIFAEKGRPTDGSPLSYRINGAG